MKKWGKICGIISITSILGIILFCNPIKAESISQQQFLSQGQTMETANTAVSENFLSTSGTTSTSTTATAALNEIASKIEYNDALITTLKENQKLINQSYKEKIADLKKNPKTNVTKQDLDLVKSNLKKVDSEQKKMERDSAKIKRSKKKFDKYMKDSNYEKAEKEGKAIIEKQEYQLKRADNINNWFAEIMSIFQK